MTKQNAVISIRFTNELKDHLEAQRFLYSKGWLTKIDKVVAIGLLGLGVYAVYAVGPRWWAVIWFPLAVVEWFNLLSLDRVRVKVAFERNPRFREEYHLTFSPENIHFKTISIESVLQWSHYERVEENAHLFLLLYGKGMYTLIPKRGFSSDDEVNAFRALLAKKVPAKTTKG